MQTVSNPSNQPNQSNTNLQGNHTGLDKSQFSLSRPQVLSVVILIGLILISLSILGVWAGEKRALRKQSLPSTQPTPTNIQPSPTPTPPTATPAPTTKLPPASSEEHRPVGPKTVTPVETKEEKEPPTTCRDRFDCIRCIGFNEICETGECINGVCVWPT